MPSVGDVLGQHLAGRAAEKNATSAAACPARIGEAFALQVEDAPDRALPLRSGRHRRSHSASADARRAHRRRQLGEARGAGGGGSSGCRIAMPGRTPPGTYRAGSSRPSASTLASGAGRRAAAPAVAGRARIGASALVGPTRAASRPRGAGSSRRRLRRPSPRPASARAPAPATFAVSRQFQRAGVAAGARSRGAAHVEAEHRRAAPPMSICASATPATPTTAPPVR